MEYHIKVLSHQVKPYWYSYGQLRLRKDCLEFINDNPEIGSSKLTPIIIGIQNPQYSRLYEQIQSLHGVHPVDVGNIVQFDDYFYKMYIRVILIQVKQ